MLWKSKSFFCCNDLFSNNYFGTIRYCIQIILETQTTQLWSKTGLRSRKPRAYVFYRRFHFAVGYRYHKFRFRASIINGGTYNADAQAVGDVDEGYNGITPHHPDFSWDTTCGKKLWKYGYYERHTFEVEQMATGENRISPPMISGSESVTSFLFCRTFYIQPGIHSYFRAEQSINFNDGGTYTIPTFELSPVVRIGARLWREVLIQKQHPEQIKASQLVLQNLAVNKI